MKQNHININISISDELMNSLKTIVEEGINSGLNTAEYSSEEWITTNEVLRRYKVSRTTLYKYRKAFKIDFVVLNRKVYYNGSSILYMNDKYLKFNFGNNEL